MRAVPILLIGIGGFFGAIARYAVDTWITDAARTAFPWGTLAVNATGSFALGLLFALTAGRGPLSEELRLPLGVGFLGAYTTFSTFALESLRLAESGSWGLALANIGGSVLLGIAAVLLGVAIGRAIA